MRREIMTKKRGRPARKDVERGASGRIKTEVIERDATALGKWQRAKDIILTLLPDTRLGTPLGRMLILGHPEKITVAEYEAGERLYRILQDYDHLVLGVGRDPKGIDPNGQAGRVLREDPDAELIKRSTDAMMRAEQTLGMVTQGPSGHRVASGSVIASATKALVRGTGYELQLHEAVLGLKALAAGWGLDRIPQSKIRRAGQKMHFTAESRIRQFSIKYAEEGGVRGNRKQANRAKMAGISHGAENASKPA
jgi:hypothetical protein